MTNRTNGTLVAFFSLSVAAGGAHDVLGGKDDMNSLARNLLVGVQILAGLAVAIWAWKKRRA